MASVRMNVLVYSGLGTTVESVRHVLYSLRRILSPYYSISAITADTILKEPWTVSCALLVIPGGGDLGYCRALNGEGNRRIQQYVRRGGSYLGLCAGGYYGSARVEFMVGDPEMEVVGSRELAFFPGTCRGCAFTGFQYADEAGARAAEIKVEKECFTDGGVPELFRTYYNGGGIFVEADKLKEKKVEVLATFTEPVDVEGGDAAVVHIKVGDGNVILTGPHPEFAGVNLDKNAGGPEYADIVDTITRDHDKQVNFLKGCFHKLGLKVNEGTVPIPSLTHLHLTSIYPEDVRHLVTNLSDLITDDDGQKVIVGENDTFILQEPKPLSLESLSLNDPPHTDGDGDKIIDYDKVRKTVYTQDKEYPSKTETPWFNHQNYYNALSSYRWNSRSTPSQMGSFLLYGEVVTSTSTMLDKNFQLLQKLPNGLTAVGTLQIAGRGRGNNVWVSPMGSLLYSTLLKHSVTLSSQAPVAFVQYLAAMAIIEGVKQYGSGYNEVPVKLKWPNDIYAEDPQHVPASKTDVKYVKIGGILVTSTYANNEYLLVIGCGLNLSNKAPTTSLNALLEKVNRARIGRGLAALAPYQPERLLARILVLLDEFYYRFSLTGFKEFEAKYYEHWIHSDQIVRLDMEGGTKARIRGITLDHGLLRAEEVDRDNQPTGRVFTLQSDGNSFDFFNGLLKAKR